MEKYLNQTKKIKILVIGSGAGGAVISSKLAEANFDVNIYEEGSAVNTVEIEKSLVKPLSKYYRYGGVLPVFAKPIIGFAEGRVFGGTTEINGGLLWRTPKRILDSWRLENSISSEFYDSYDGIFSSIEKRLGVNKVNPIVGNKDSIMLQNSANKFNWKIVEVPRAVINCKQDNRCASVCIKGSKQSMALTYLRDAENAGAKVFTNSKIIKLIMDGTTCKGVLIKRNEQYEKIYLDFVFLSAGAIQTPIILRRSGIKKNIGNNLALHLNLRFLVVFNEDVNASKGTIFTHQLQEFEDKGILLMATNFRQQWVYSAIESRYPVTSEEIQNFDRKGALFTAQIRPKGIGKVRSLGSLATFVTYNILDKDIELALEAINISCKLFFNSGARYIYLPISGSKPIHSMVELSEVLENLDLRRKLELLAVHAMASCPMGVKADSAVDHMGKLKGYDNIYLADASVLPSNIGESPQGTIMYFSHFIAKKFIENLR